MNGHGGPARAALAALVGAHLIIAFVHGAAHGQAHVPLSPAGNVFVLLVIVAGPVIGLALTWWHVRTGAHVVAIAMAGSFAFGVINHFVLAGPDHVTAVAAQWRP